VIGSLQAIEVQKIIFGHKDVMSCRLLLYDGESCSFRNIKLRPKNKNCEVCGESPTITELIDYEQFCGMAATDKDTELKLLDSTERILVEMYDKDIDRNHILIDVRSANEFEICQLKNSINVPIKILLSGKLDESLKQRMREDEVFVVCRRGNDSQLAVKYLKEELQIVSKDLIGGLHAWSRRVDSNFPIY
jgi:adenylyltransferase and sulfurtransferase